MYYINKEVAIITVDNHLQRYPSWKCHLGEALRAKVERSRSLGRVSSFPFGKILPDTKYLWFWIRPIYLSLKKNTSSSVHQKPFNDFFINPPPSLGYNNV